MTVPLILLSLTATWYFQNLAEARPSISSSLAPLRTLQMQRRTVKEFP